MAIFCFVCLSHRSNIHDVTALGPSILALNVLARVLALVLLDTVLQGARA